MSRGIDQNDCRTGADIVRFCETNNNGIVQRNGGRMAYVSTAIGAVQIHEGNSTLTKAERLRIWAALKAIGAIAALLAVVLLVLGAGII